MTTLSTKKTKTKKKKICCQKPTQQVDKNRCSLNGSISEIEQRKQVEDEDVVVMIQIYTVFTINIK